MTEHLQEILASNENIQVFDTIILSHPNFSRTFYLINDVVNRDLNVDGTLQTFEAMAFRLELPTYGEAQQDLKVILPNIGYDLIIELENAISSPDVPISVRMLTYVEDSQDPQMELNDLTLGKIVANDTTINATASRKDLFGHYILDHQLFDSRFEGLYL